MHQKEAKLFNNHYDNIIKNTMENRVLKVENSIMPPDSSQDSSLMNMGSVIS